MAEQDKSTEMTVTELRAWLRNWVADATGQPAENISEDRPMEELGLSSRDAIALSGDVEDLTGVMATGEEEDDPRNDSRCTMAEAWYSSGRDCS